MISHDNDLVLKGEVARLVPYDNVGICICNCACCEAGSSPGFFYRHALGRFNWPAVSGPSCSSRRASRSLMARAVLGDAGMPGSFQIGGTGPRRAWARGQ